MRNFSGNVRKATFGKQYRKSFKKDTGAEAAPTADHESIHLPTLNASPNAGVGAVSRQNSRVCATSYFGNAQRDIGGRPFLCQIKKGVWCPFCVGRHKTIVDMQNLAKKRGGRCLSRSYSGKEKKLLWECSLGHRWKAVPGSIIMGTWCPACGGTQKRTIEEMKQMALKRGGKCLSNEYANIETKLLWECAEGHRWEAQPNGIRSGSWCPQCSSALAERICREYFEQLFGKRFPKVKPSWLRLANKSRLELDGYCEKLGLAFEHQGPHHYGLDIYSPITNERAIRQKERDRLKRLLCRKNGVILISVPEIPTRLPQNEIKDFIRSECEKRKIKLPKDFDSKKVNLRDAYAVPETKRQLDRLTAIAKERGGRCLSRAYKGHYVKLLWQCRHLHRWKAQPADIKGGQWCPYCSFQRLTIHDMRATAEKKGGKCLSGKYSGGKVKLIWECAKGHRWKAVPSSVRAGTWCPVCAGTQRLTIEDLQKIARKWDGNCLSRQVCQRQNKTALAVFSGARMGSCARQHSARNLVSSMRSQGACKKTHWQDSLT